MSVIEAIILGIIQGLTEFLPVSSDGHLEIGEVLLGIKQDKSLAFTMVIHAATSLSAVVVFRNEIRQIFAGLLKFKWNAEWDFAAKVVLSMIPVGIIGLFFEDQVEALFEGDLVLVGGMLCLTGSILFIPSLLKPGNRDVNYLDAFLVGLAQAAAVLPGLSRSGSTISTGLSLGISRDKMAKFSFLMVIPPIFGKVALDMKDYLFPDADFVPGANEPGASAMIAGFIVSFIVGLVACSAMINLVKKGKLWWFGVYAILMGLAVVMYAKGWIG